MPISTKSSAITLPSSEPSLQDAIGLIALFSKMEQPLRFRNIPISPTKLLEEDVFGRLLDRKLIWSEKSGSQKMAADWDAIKTISQNVRELANSHIWPTHWVEESKEFWMKLAAAECTEFFKFCLTERNIVLEDEAMVYENLKTLFPMYSVGQCYFFIFIGAKDMSDAIQKGYSGKKSETQLMLDACFKCEDYYHKKKKMVANFRRHQKLPVSLLHTIFHTQFFTHGEEGFNSPPHCFVVN